MSWREAWTGCWSHRDPVPPLLVQGHKNAVHRLSQVESRAASSSVILQLGFVPPLVWEYRRPFWCMGLRCQGPREMETVCVPRGGLHPLLLSSCTFSASLAHRAHSPGHSDGPMTQAGPIPRLVLW